jgi:hypothetical protein
MDTASIAAPMTGDKLYEKRAQAALPVLVRQAEVCRWVTYSDLAQELGMPNPRNLNFVLGSIGNKLKILSKEWKEDIPPIQCLVVNKQTHVPGKGFWPFLGKGKDFAALNGRQKGAIVQEEHRRIFTYQRWKDVLTALKLSSAKAVFHAQREHTTTEYSEGGESESHRLLKEFVAGHPAVIGLAAKTPRGDVEYRLPSSDTVDVMFKDNRDWIAVEVKSKISSEDDIQRGLFQCVKYYALVEAEQIALELPPNAHALLALEGKLPKSLIWLRNRLGVQVVEMVRAV